MKNKEVKEALDTIRIILGFITQRVARDHLKIAAEMLDVMKHSSICFFLNL